MGLPCAALKSYQQYHISCWRHCIAKCKLQEISLKNDLRITFKSRGKNHVWAGLYLQKKSCDKISDKISWDMLKDLFNIDIFGLIGFKNPFELFVNQGG